MPGRAVEGPRAIELSLRLLNHPDDMVRHQTWTLLSELYGQDILVYLRRLRDHGPGEMQQLAKNILASVDQLKIEHTSQSTRLLHVFCLGTFRVCVGSRVLQPGDWAGNNGSSRGGGLKAQAMLAYLLHCGAQGATEDEIIAAIWGENPSNSSSLARTQTHLFDVLDGSDRPRGQCRFIVKNKRHLMVRPELCSSDAERFLLQWRHAQQTEDEDSLACAMPLYEELAQQYTGLYMQTIPKGWDWHLDRAQNLQSTYLMVLERLATSEYIAGRHVRCRSICQEGLLIDRSDPVLTEKLLVVLADLDLPAEATRAFIYYLEAAGLQPNTPEYDEDFVVQAYWHYWPDSARKG